MEGSSRQREILKAVVDSYIATGEPVGSKAVAAALKKPCSSATVRNEMAELEKLGLLEQPHTSAGRIPTRRGYSLYVDELMENVSLSFEESLLLHSVLTEARRGGDKGLQDLSKLLARMTKCAVITFSRSAAGTIERFEGVFIHPHAFLLVMITSSGRALTRQLSSPFPLEAEAVEFLIRVLNENLAKKELGAVTMERIAALEESLGEYRGMISVILQVIYDAMDELGKTAVVKAGLANLFAYPEFHDPAHTGRLLEEIEDETALIQRFTETASPTLQVHIGTGEKGLSGASFVTCPFRIGKRRRGIACIIGPKRMDYAGVMAKLEYLSKQMGSAQDFEPALPLIETGNDNE